MKLEGQFTETLGHNPLMNMIRPTKSPLYGDKAAVERSAARISSLGDATIHFGHGKPVKNRMW